MKQYIRLFRDMKGEKTGESVFDADRLNAQLDVLKDAENRGYNKGIDDAIALCNSYRMGQPLRNPLESNPLQNVVFKLQQLKKQ